MLDRLIEVLICSAIFGAIIAASAFASPDKTNLKDTAMLVGCALALLALIPAVFYVLFGVSPGR